MSREDALTQLESPAYDPEDIKHEFEFVANKLGISVEELQTYFNMPKKTHLDYKSHENIYKLGSKLMRLMGLERGGKR